MNTYAQEDLFRPQSSSSSQTSSSLASSNLPVTAQNSSEQSIDFLGSVQFDSSFLDLSVRAVNLFALTWTVFYTFFFLIEFFNYRIYFHGGELAKEKKGVKAIYAVIGMWWRYLLGLSVFVIYGLTHTTIIGVFFGLLTILVFIIKIYFDLGKILNLLDYFPWSKGIAKNIKNSLKLK